MSVVEVAVVVMAVEVVVAVAVVVAAVALVAMVLVAVVVTVVVAVVAVVVVVVEVVGMTIMGVVVVVEVALIRERWFLVGLLANDDAEGLSEIFNQRKLLVSSNIEFWRFPISNKLKAKYGKLPTQNYICLEMM